MKKFLKMLLSWPVLAVEAVALMVVCWPWAGHWVSVFWGIVTISVLLSELLNKIFSPKKQTVSNNIQDEAINDFGRWLLMISIWLFFSLTLAGHFALKLF